jgi:stage II sporulation protein Q
MVAEVMKMREEEKKRSSQKWNMQSFFRKRWVFPALYLALAAILISGILWYQTTGDDVAEPQDYGSYGDEDLQSGKGFDNPAVEVNRAVENILMPVENEDEAQIVTQFYDFNGSEEEQVAALVVYKNNYYPSQGIDIGMKNGESFDVLAALSGTVKEVKEDSFLGNVIEIEHDNGVVTRYQSVKDIAVEVGDDVEQGQVIAKAGKSEFNQEAGVHVHFEIRKNDVAVNPLDYFNKSLSSLDEVGQAEEQSSDKEETTEEKSAEENEQSSDSTSDNE